jgi:phage portal protein BeeE
MLYGEMVSQESTRTPDNPEDKYGLAMASAWVASNLRIRSDALSATDARPMVKQRGKTGDTNERNHPFELLLDKPNSFMSGAFMLRYISQWYDLRGNAYLFLVTPAPGRGEITEILPLPANMVSPQPHTLRDGVGVFKGRQVIDYMQLVNGKYEWLPGENVVHFRTPNPFDYWEGLSPLASALLAAEMDEAQAAWTRDFFKKENAVPSAVIALSETISEDEFDRLVHRLRTQMEEGQKRLFTRSGDLDVKMITQTLEQMQIIDSRKFNRDEIDRVYGTEGLFSGHTSGEARLAADIAFRRYAVQPVLDYFAEQLSADVVPYYEDGIMVEAPNTIPQDRALEVQEYTVYQSDRSVNENRKERGLDPWKAPKGLEPLTDLADIPVRLLPMAQAVLAPKPEPQDGNMTSPNEEEQLQVGDMPGAQTPESMADDLAGKAAHIALATELKRWRKVAISEVRTGHNPAERDFQTVIIPQSKLPRSKRGWRRPPRKAR